MANLRQLELQPLIRNGRSFSGRERHCCFLNTGSRRFADISTISGLNLADDGRAAARVDWDQDGDLDLWVSNRNGPQVRFLRNGVPTNHHYISVRLQGVTCNRDAVGARLQLVLAGNPKVRLSKTLRAGEGFLSQSTKWIHFGLGNATKIDRLIVRWPGGSTEEFRGLVVDRHHHIVQATGRAQVWDGPKRHVALEAGPLAEPASTDLARTFLASRVPLPSLDYRTFDGETARVSSANGQPLLLNLWASWCTPCIEELGEFTRRERELRSVGLDVLALTVGQLRNTDAAENNSAASLLATLDFPFSTGIGSVALLDKLQIVHDQLFDRHVILPLPSSFLIDSDGQLAAIYKGPVDVDRVLADVGKLALRDEQLRHAALDFSGRWIGAPARISLVPIYRELLAQGFRTDATEFVVRNHTRFPNRTILHLAQLLATDPDPTLRDGAEAVRWGEKVAEATNYKIAEVLDVLAAAYAEAGQFDKAESTAGRAIELAQFNGNAKLQHEIELKLRFYQDGRPYHMDDEP